MNYRGGSGPTVYGPNGQPVSSNQAGDAQQQVLMYHPRGYPVAVGSDAVSVRGLKDPNPETNRWAGADCLWLLVRCVVKRPLATGVVMLAAWFGTQLALSVMAGGVLVASGKSRAVDYNQLTDKSSAVQVGYWLGSSIGAPALKGASATLVNYAEQTAPKAVMVSTGQERQTPFTREASFVVNPDQR